MFCPKCGTEIKQRSKYCPNCGNKRKQSFALVVMLLIFLSVSGLVFLELSKLFDRDVAVENVEPVTASNEKESIPEPEPTEIAPVVKVEQPKEPEEARELTEIIADAQENVFTIFSTYSQGSGFLYNNSGIVVTNAHVVEGDLAVTVRAINGTEHHGEVIGYSNEIDVAIIKVTDFIGRTPSKISYEEPSLIGEEVVALGSPLGLENTASMGYITGVNRDFIIDNFIYSDLYQISAPISPGSSGGPLLSQETEHIIAINSAKDTRDSSIGFSIPIYTIYPLIESWINQPMTADEINAQFYYSGALYFNEYVWESYDGGFFDGGDYSDDTSHFEYWEYEYEYEEYDDSFYEEDSYYEDNYQYEEYNEPIYEESYEDHYYEDEYLYEEEIYEEPIHDEDSELWMNEHPHDESNSDVEELDEELKSSETE